MTVSDLIDRLQQYPDHCEVLFHHMDFGIVDLKINDFDRVIDAIVFEPEPQPDGSYKQIDIIDYYEDE